MVAQDQETMGSCNSPPTILAFGKGKRTRRQRIPSAPADVSSSSAPSSSTTTTEDEEMANCLILLSRSPTVNPPSADGKSGFSLYECKTCNKCFSSFQALGGHRASHKKLKITMEDREIEKRAGAGAGAGVGVGGGSNKTKIHDCSICRAEFSSGQALGGHMRRHRPPPPPVKKEVFFLPLDLNLPAPFDDDRMDVERLTFAGGRPKVFSSTTALVLDCHY